VAAGAPDPAWDVKIRRRWLYIVIHHSATESGSAASFHRSHRRDRGWDGLGYHFVIGNGEGSADGLVETGYRWSRQLTGAHAGRPRPDVNLMNERGIGICLVGDFNRRPPTPRQIASLHRLVDWLCARLSIPANRVLVHRDIRGTECPGKHFPASEFLTPRRDVPASYR
jgi:N-acetyl-anhydromuramyl-L-alanine amidase AmpD